MLKCYVKKLKLRYNHQEIRQMETKIITFDAEARNEILSFF